MPGRRRAPGETLPATTTTTHRRRRPRRRSTSLPPCPVDALDDGAEPVELTFWHGLADRARGHARRADRPSTTPARTRCGSTLENQGGYKQTIDKYVQSSQDEPAAPGDVARVHGPADRRQRARVIPVGACIEASGFDTSAFLPGVLESYQTERRAVVDAVQRQRPGPVLQPGRCSRPPDSTSTIRRCRSRSCGRRRRRSSTPGAARTASPSTPASTPAAAWFLEQWFAKAGRAVRRQRQRPAGAGDAGALRRPSRASTLMTEVQSLITDGLAVTVGDNPSGAGRAAQAGRSGGSRRR